MRIDIETFTSLEFDALKEVANIGAAHAATALSQMIEKTVLISVTEVHLIQVEEIVRISENPKAKVVLVHLKLLGSATGGLILLWTWEDALKFAAVLKKERSVSQDLTEMDISVLKEAGSILSAAYLKAIGDLLHLSLIPAVSELSYGEIGMIAKSLIGNLSKRSEIAFCLETQFEESHHKIRGKFLLIPEVKSLEVMFHALGIGVRKESKLL